MFGLDNLINLLFDSAMENLSRNERVIQTLKRLKLDPDHPPEDFTGVYQYALVEYGVGKPRPVLEIFRQSEIQQLFREALEQNNPAKLLQHGEAFLADHPLQADLQANNIDVRREFYAFAAVFIEVAKRTRTPAAILAEQKLESLHRQIATVQERLGRLPTLEGLRTEMARLATTPSLALPPGESFGAEECKAFALAQQMRGWFETLGFRLETHEVWQDDYFEWIINIPVRRGRYDRILVRGINGEAGLRDVEALKQSVETHRTDEGWLVTARRISRAARDEVGKPENDGLGCYTLDELLDQDADFSGYLTWLEAEIQKRGIAEKYVPLACLKEDIDPDTKQQLGVSRYDDRDGWIDGYIDLWLDDPAKEHISVLGEFGTGKTWFALHYAWKALQRYREAQQRGLERPRLPLVIPLRDYAKAVSVESLFSEFFFRKHEIPIPGYSVFEQLNRMGKLLLIFDGFDEMAARVNRQEMINNFWELAKVVVPGAKVILTCRTEHFPEAKEGRALLNAELQASTRDLTGETPQFEVLELEKFNDGQIRQVLAHQAQPATVEQIMGNPQLLDLARRPVLTELILEALPDIEAGKPVDMSRVYLYAVRHKMERDIKEERTFTSMADKLYFMCELSWEMLSTDRMSINYREFPDRIRKLFGSAVQEEKDLDHWHYDMMGQTMLIRNAEGDYTPAHRSLLEFFVAYKFAAELEILSKDFRETFAISQASFEGDLIITFGKNIINKATLDLLIPMLDQTIAKDKLLSAVFSTKHKSKREVGYIGGNSITLLLRLNLRFLESQDLSDTVIAGSNLLNSTLRNANLTNADLSESLFPDLLGSVLSVQFSPDGRHFVSGEADGVIRLWDTLGEKQIMRTTQHTDWVSTVVFSPDGQLLATGSHDRSIKVWKRETGECLSQLLGHTGQVRAITFTPNGKNIISGGDDRTVRVWDVETGECLKSLKGHKGWILSIRTTYDGLAVLSCSADKTIKLWNLKTGECLKEFISHTGWVESLDITPDNKIIVSGSSDRTIKVWDVNSGECVKTLTGHKSYINSIKIDSSGTRLVSGDNEGMIKVWDMVSGKCTKTFQGHFERIRGVDISRDNNLLLSAGDTDIKIWNFNSFECLKVHEGCSHRINDLDISKDGTLLACGGEDKKIRIFYLEKYRSKQSEYFEGHSKWIGSVVIHPDGITMASGGGDSTIRLWDIESRECVSILRDHTGNIHSLSVSPDGSTLASGSADSKIYLWNFEDISQKKPIRKLLGHEHWVNSVSFSSDGQLLASGSNDKNIKIWKVDSGECLKTLTDHEDCIWSVVFSPINNNVLVSRGDNLTLKIWDLASGECIKDFSSQSGRASAMAFSSDGKILATANINYTINLWDPLSGESLATLEGHQNRIQSLIFDSTNNHIITCGYDETVRIWDIKTNQCVDVLSNRPYAETNIHNVKGLTQGEISRLKVLGAVET
ncbi:MAG: hypothetical protein DCF32_10410 [Leptolyngbya sp.]|nr:MAG: hypothetical protein DCF32_10410 [Leptolyngbya sp.]